MSTTESLPVLSVTESSLPSPTTTLFLASAILTLALLYFYNGPIIRWLKLKRYQYEVTFSLYMLTPMEKFVFSTFLVPLHSPSPSMPPIRASSRFPRSGRFCLFGSRLLPSLVSTVWSIHANGCYVMADSILFLIISMIIIAASLYLPEHIATIAKRVWYYASGDEGIAREKLVCTNSGAGVGLTDLPARCSEPL